MTNSPRRAFWRRASTERCRSKSSSYSLSTTLQPQKQPIIAATRIVDGLVVNEQRVHHGSFINDHHVGFKGIVPVLIEKAGLDIIA